MAQLSPDGHTLVYSTYLGGNGDDEALGIAVAPDLSINVTGWTKSSSTFPLQSAYQGSLHGTSDAFITKVITTQTSWAYSTYLGGSGDEQGTGIAVDDLGAAFVTGWTASTNFPVQGPYQSANAGGKDSFVTKLSPTGTSLT